MATPQRSSSDVKCVELMRAFGAKCQNGRVGFAAPASQKVQDGDAALGPYSPIRATLQRCCDHSFAELSNINASRSDYLAYDIDEKTGLLKWLGPLYDANEDRAASRSGSSNSSSRGSSGGSSGGSSSSQRKTKAPEKSSPEWVVADVLHDGNDEKSSKDISFSEEKLPKYWIRPFGELLLHGKTPHPGAFGVAYVVVANPNGSLKHRMQFGQVLGMKDGRYIFWAPHPGRKENVPGRILIPATRFAPAFVDEKKGQLLPKVKWAYDASKHADVPTSAKTTAKTQKESSHRASSETRLSDKLVSRLRRAAGACRKHMDAKELVKELESVLESEEKQRKALRKPRKSGAAGLQKIMEEESKWRERAGTLRRQLKSTRKLLQNKDPACAQDVEELLAQEEADRCRHNALDAVPAEDVSLRKTIEHGQEWEARRAISSLIASYEQKLDQSDPAARKTLRTWADDLKKCSVKILAPSERDRPLPKSLVRSEMEAATKGHGFSKAAEEKLLKDCKGSESERLIEALLQNKGKEHDVDEWNEIRESLAEEKAGRATRFRAMQCEKTIDALVKSVQTKGCREVLLEALRKAGVRSNRGDSAQDLGKLFSLKVRAAQKGGRVELLRTFQGVMHDEKVPACLDALDLPDLATPDIGSSHPSEVHEEPMRAYSKEEEGIIKACASLNDEESEAIVDKIMQTSDDKIRTKLELEKLSKRLSQIEAPEVAACKASVERMHAARS